MNKLASIALALTALAAAQVATAATKVPSDATPARAVPSKPDRFGGLVVVLVAAIGAGVLSGVMVELRDESIRDERQLRGELPLPVLAIVPAMNGRTERRVLMPATPLRREHQSSDSLN